MHGPTVAGIRPLFYHLRNTVFVTGSLRVCVVFTCVKTGAAVGPSLQQKNESSSWKKPVSWILCISLKRLCEGSSEFRVRSGTAIASLSIQALRSPPLEGRNTCGLDPASFQSAFYNQSPYYDAIAVKMPVWTEIAGAREVDQSNCGVRYGSL